jgi:hypothetical protein
MGTVAGDTGLQYTAVFTGYGEQMFHLRVSQDTTSCTYVSATFQLQSPPGIEYDLYQSFSCAGSGVASTGNGAGNAAYVGTCNCGFYCDGSDGYDTWVWVIYNSGTGCGTWSLQAEGDTLVNACASVCP